MGKQIKKSSLILKSGFYVADCVRFMKQKMRDNIVDLTVTSPPL